jgi:hypothetical protein
MFHGNIVVSERVVEGIRILHRLIVDRFVEELIAYVVLRQFDNVSTWHHLRCGLLRGSSSRD